ncbi:minor tail protein Z (GPZ) [Chryseobacterium sp. 7]|uniref:phage tail protein n=1 Tax=Chryseobacterium sp. 7 TaxID=2035214 RepID=UPI000EAE9258|nr:phage tail protein [Chryseobacterium sp. 7]RLJ31389.1 minor tail protein Z (GPZ) [Chryseobacterium sp. 7]
MIQVTIAHSSNGLNFLQRQLDDKNLKKASTRALNKAVAKGNTLYRRMISEHYNIKPTHIRSSIILKKATYNKAETSISGNIRPLSLSRFNPQFVNGRSVISIRSVRNRETGRRTLQQTARNASRNEQAGGGVSIEIKKGSRKVIPYAFLTKSQANTGVEKQIFARGKYAGGKFQKAKERFPITAMKTTSVFGILTHDPIQKKIETESKETLQREFERQIYLLTRR